MAFISLVDEQREFFKAGVGSDSANRHAISRSAGTESFEDGPLVIADALDDPRFAGQPTGHPELRQVLCPEYPYERPTASPSECWCVKDTRPRHLSTRQLNALTVLAHQVVNQFELGCARRATQQQANNALQLADDALAAVLALVPRPAKPHAQGLEPVACVKTMAARSRPMIRREPRTPPLPLSPDPCVPASSQSASASHFSLPRSARWPCS